MYYFLLNSKILIHLYNHKSTQEIGTIIFTVYISYICQYLSRTCLSTDSHEFYTEMLILMSCQWQWGFCIMGNSYSQFDNLLWKSGIWSDFLILYMNEFVHKGLSIHLILNSWSTYVNDNFMYFHCWLVFSVFRSTNKIEHIFCARG